MKALKTPMKNPSLTKRRLNNGDCNPIYRPISVYVSRYAYRYRVRFFQHAHHFVFLEWLLSLSGTQTVWVFIGALHSTRYPLLYSVIRLPLNRWRRETDYRFCHGQYWTCPWWISDGICYGLYAVCGGFRLITRNRSGDWFNRDCGHG